MRNNFQFATSTVPPRASHRCSESPDRHRNKRLTYHLSTSSLICIHSAPRGFICATGLQKETKSMKVEVDRSTYMYLPACTYHHQRGSTSTTSTRRGLRFRFDFAGFQNCPSFHCYLLPVGFYPLVTSRYDRLSQVSSLFPFFRLFFSSLVGTFHKGPGQEQQVT